MITCPNCGASLADWAKQCQFCQVDTSQVVRPKQDKPTAGAFATPSWIWASYYAVSGYMLVSAGIEIAMIIGNPGKDGIGFFGTVLLVYYGITALVGIGLLAKVGFIRAAVNWICFIGILANLFGGVEALEGIMFIGPIMILSLVLNLFNICVYGFMIFLIGETDRHFY